MSSTVALAQGCVTELWHEVRHQRHGGKTMSIHTELDELVATNCNANMGVLSPESAEPQDAHDSIEGECWR